MAGERVLKIRVVPEVGVTHFNVEFSADALTWTPYSTASASPVTPEDLAVGLLDASSDYTLDGVNAPAGNEAAASIAGNWYHVRLKNAGGYGNYSSPFKIAEYPAGADLEAFLEGTGITVGATLSPLLEAAVQGATAEFEGAIQRRLLAGPLDSIRYFDPPVNRDGLLHLAAAGRDGELASFTSVVYQPQGSTAETLTQGTDYVLEERNALTQGHAYSRVRFGSYRRWGSPQSLAYRGALQITGRWGAMLTFPLDAWQAILCYAALSMFPPARYNATGGVLDWKEDDVAEGYGIEVTKDLLTGWQMVYKSAVLRYRRWSLI